MTEVQVQGVHLVGSVNLPTTTDTFTLLPPLLPGRLKRIPDGEPGPRHYFTLFQMQMLHSHNPKITRKYDENINVLPSDPVSPEEVESIVKGLPELRTGYDTAALESYELFKQMRDEGKIESGTKFQVCLPGIVNVLCLVADPFQPLIEPLYEAAFLRDLASIQAQIPAKDLAIQIDIASEFALLEGPLPPHFHAWFPNVKEHLLELLVRAGDAVNPNVELGLHLCYGDIAHKHFKEPADTGLLVEVTRDLLKRLKRPVNWIHLPVPKDRDDEAYFTPLKDLELGETELFLGLVHAGDLEGTQRRIKTASKVVKKFGVGTECGLGRTPPEEFEDIMQISAKVSQPWS